MSVLIVHALSYAVSCYWDHFYQQLIIIIKAIADSPVGQILVHHYYQGKKLQKASNKQKY